MMEVSPLPPAVTGSPTTCLVSWRIYSMSRLVVPTSVVVMKRPDKGIHESPVGSQ